ncbi:hypothetical protein TorRG33x02_120290 [Trema orientale]|uniref:Transmembrane protein n=1 Tax=Trema orientale TaxID=63057 RepID=A0A2P5F338_TREOI|nr:hypothetical protein TorRG33x02_120290 [Trema orientale]
MGSKDRKHITRYDSLIWCTSLICQTLFPFLLRLVPPPYQWYPNHLDDFFSPEIDSPVAGDRFSGRRRTNLKRHFDIEYRFSSYEEEGVKEKAIMVSEEPNKRMKLFHGLGLLCLLMLGLRPLLC